MVFIAERFVNIFLHNSKAVFNVPLPVAVAVSPKVKILPSLCPELFARLLKNLRTSPWFSAYKERKFDTVFRAKRKSSMAVSFP